MNVTTDPWVTAAAYANCEHCGEHALRDSTEPVPAGVQFLCSRCVRRGILPNVAEFTDEQLAALVADLTGRQPAPDSYHSRVLAGAQKKIADRAAEQAKYDVMASFDAPTDDDTCWSFSVLRNGRVHAEMRFPPDEGTPPLGLQSLTAADCEAIGKALLEAAEHAKRQAATPGGEQQ